MNKAKALLDSLMGPARDVKKDENSKDWKDRTVCKSFLIGFCPNEKKALGGKRTIEVCPKIHSEIIKATFEEHKDGKPGSEFRIRCEEIALRDLEYVVGECEAHAKSEAERIKREPKSRRLPPEANIKISAMKREREQLLLKAETLDDCAARENENLTKQAQTLQDDAEAYQKEEERKVAEAAPKTLLCDICATAYTGDEENEKHLKYKVHGAYAKVREQMALLKKNREDREAAETEKRVAERERKKKEAEDGKDGEKDGEEKKKKLRDIGEEDEKKRSKSRDRKKDRKGSRSRDKEKESKGKDRKSSRSREKGKDRRRSLSRDKEKNRKSSRSRDRGKNRKGSRSREKNKDRKGSKSRSPKKGDRDKKDKDRDRDRGRSRSRSRSRRRR